MHACVRAREGGGLCARVLACVRACVLRMCVCVFCTAQGILGALLIGEAVLSTLEGWVNRAKEQGGGGFWKRAQLTGPLISHYELWRRRRRSVFGALKMVKTYFHQIRGNR